jgi:ubiquinone/menaquinone biosynthesis C-methylase UbiE
MKNSIENKFFEFYSWMNRQGPGSLSDTKRAFDALNLGDKKIKVLDIGCGAGAQTMDLASLVNGEIIGIDKHKIFLDKFKSTYSKQADYNKVTLKIGDMNDIQEEPESFDLIWAEGSIYIMGFENGLQNWKKFIKTNGYLVVSEISWMKDEIPEELKEYWTATYKEIDTIENKLEKIKKNGYEIIDHFSLSEEAWADEYYVPLSEKLDRFMEKYAGDDEAEIVADCIDDEIELYEQYAEYFGYEFYIMRKA